MYNLFGVKKNSDNLIGKYADKSRNKVYSVYKNTKGRYYKVGSKKIYLKKGTRLTYSRKKPKKPKKIIKTKKTKKTKRLSARNVYNKDGKKALGKTFRILQKDGTYVVKILKLRKNGSPYFANKFGALVKFPLNLNIKGNSNNLTGYNNTWPNYPFTIPPSGVNIPDKMNLYPKGVHFHKNKFGKKVMCFG